MALGSSFELETQLIIIEELSIISDEDIEPKIRVWPLAFGLWLLIFENLRREYHFPCSVIYNNHFN